MNRLFVVIFLLVCGIAGAHPIPEFPVRSSFAEGGKAIIKAEVDPRIWAEVPEKAPSLLNKDYAVMNDAAKAVLIEKAKFYAKENAEFFFLPLGQVTPEFTWKITGEKEAALAKDDDPVVITGTWETTVPTGIAGYQIKAAEKCKVCVYFLNTLRGQELERMAVLFPGEKSFVLDLAGLGGTAVAIGGAVNEKSGSDWLGTFMTFIHQGFIHVLPMGLDHILFVVGLFLLSRKLRPLLYQVTTFTIAHTITLALAATGKVSVSGTIVEPVIAGSIAVVALENIYHSKYSRWRLLIVFVFGLIHGLGFAGALSDLEIPESSLVPGLLGFNVGVEFGQLAVIAGALLLTLWIKDQAQYRKYVVIPASLIIAALGLYWMVRRIMGWE